MDIEKLKELKFADLRDINMDRVMNINDIFIDQEKPKEERIRAYLETNDNPYIIKCNNTLVKMSFSDNNMLIQECIERYLIDCLNERL